MSRLRIVMLMVALISGCATRKSHVGVDGYLLRSGDCSLIRSPDREVEFERVIDSAGDTPLPYHVQLHVGRPDV
jgi:hypothetical protein